MVPRYVRVVTQIPKTETNKIRRSTSATRSHGGHLGSERAGIKLHRDKL